MVKIVNIFKAAGLWVGTIFLLYGNKPVATSAALGYTGYGALAPSRSEGGGERARVVLFGRRAGNRHTIPDRWFQAGRGLRLSPCIHFGSEDGISYWRFRVGN